MSETLSSLLLFQNKMLEDIVIGKMVAMVIGGAFLTASMIFRVKTTILWASSAQK